MNTQQPKVIFEDDYLIVVDKPAGMVVNRSETVRGIETLQDWIEKKFPISIRQLADQFPNKNEDNKDFIDRSGIVHRLDKETSGLIIIAKDPESFRNLQRQFKEGRVEKTYIALAHGKVVPSEGEINVPVGRLPWDRKRFGVIPMGRESRTLYKLLEYKILKNGKNVEDLTLLELYPKTGRTHQIRVHLRYIGHPVFADILYAGRKNIKSDRKLLSRHFLHAAKIKFYHPKSEQIIELESPLPKELSDFLLY